jgi:hypothetical protein
MLCSSRGCEVQTSGFNRAVRQSGNGADQSILPQSFALWVAALDSYLVYFNRQRLLPHTPACNSQPIGLY